MCAPRLLGSDAQDWDLGGHEGAPSEARKAEDGQVRRQLVAGCAVAPA